MRASILAIAATVAGLTSAQSLEGLPPCAQTCVLAFTSGSSIGGCPGLDIACICKSKDFLSNIACCLSSKCDAADQATAVKFAQQICQAAPGGAVSVPDQVVCTATSSTGASTSASTSAASAPATGSATTTAGSSSTSATSSSSTSASATPNAGLQNSAGTGMGIAGGLAAVLALL